MIKASSDSLPQGPKFEVLAYLLWKELNWGKHIPEVVLETVTPEKYEQCLKNTRYPKRRIEEFKDRLISVHQRVEDKTTKISKKF